MVLKLGVGEPDTAGENPNPEEDIEQVIQQGELFDSGIFDFPKRILVFTEEKTKTGTFRER
ncbi:hypothetical protein P4S70_14315 [Enterovibrio sp. Hal110]